MDKATGALHLSPTCIISSATTLADLPSMFSVPVVKGSDKQNGYSHYFVQEVRLSEWMLYFTLLYFHQQLASLSFSFYHSSGVPTSWENWNEQEEMRRAAMYETWLTTQIGPTREFSWGTVWASYDPKSGGSSIGIRYA